MFKQKTAYEMRISDWSSDVCSTDLAVRSAAETFVANPNLDVAKVISELAVGEALVSTLQDKGVPMPVQRTLMAPPRCRMGTLSDDERATVCARSPVGGRYDSALNRESAYEVRTQRAQAMADAAPKN